LKKLAQGKMMDKAKSTLPPKKEKPAEKEVEPVELKEKEKI
jgi:hypothetical protein